MRPGDKRDRPGSYTFELELGISRAPRPNALRTSEAARRELPVFLARLGAGDDGLAAECQDLLLQYCTEVVLNVLWYDRARKQEDTRNRRLTGLAVAVMVFALAGLVTESVVLMVRGAVTTSSALPLAFFSGAALTVLHVLASVGDGKARLSIFWKAGADLKDALYTFEAAWPAGRGFEPGGGGIRATAAFADAVHNELRAARAITRAERLEYFATVRSPTDVLAVAIAAADTLRARRSEVLGTLATREQHLAEAKRAVVEARGGVAASRYRRELLSTDAERQAEDAVLLRAQADLVKAEIVLRETMSS